MWNEMKCTSIWTVHVLAISRLANPVHWKTLLHYFNFEDFFFSSAHSKPAGLIQLISLTRKIPTNNKMSRTMCMHDGRGASKSRQQQQQQLYSTINNGNLIKWLFYSVINKNTHIILLSFCAACSHGFGHSLPYCT